MRSIDPARPMTWGILDVAVTELMAWMNENVYGAVMFSIYDGSRMVGKGAIT